MTLARFLIYADNFLFGRDPEIIHQLYDATHWVLCGTAPAASMPMSSTGFSAKMNILPHILITAVIILQRYKPPMHERSTACFHPSFVESLANIRGIDRTRGKLARGATCAMPFLQRVNTSYDAGPTLSPHARFNRSDR